MTEPADSPWNEPPLAAVLSQTHLEELLSRYRVCVLIFYADWVGPARMMLPVCRAVAADMTETVPFLTTNTDAQPEIAREYDIMSLPTTLLFRDSVVQKRMIGAKPPGIFAADLGEVLDVEPTDEAINPAEPDHLALTQVGARIRLVVLSPDGQYRFLDAEQEQHHPIFIWSLAAKARADTIDAFEELLSKPGVRERDIQRFLEINQEFLLGDTYSEAVPQVVLKRENMGPLIPDFILRPVVGDFCDIAELKAASSRVIRFQTNRDRFSATVYEAIAQLREYRDYFENEAHQIAIRDAYRLDLFRPRMFVIVGRRATIAPKAMRAIADDIPGYIEIRTYDDLLDRMRARLRWLEGP